MKAILLCIFALSGAGCVGPVAAGPYPHGFIAGDRMHYLSPGVSRVLYGQPVPVPSRTE